MEKVNIQSVVVGGGIVGQAIAYEVSKRFECALVEKNNYLINETSSRNSGVIHSGVYYGSDTNKNLFCLDGKVRMYEFCKKNNVKHKMTGKYIVSSRENLQKHNELVMKCVDKGIPFEEVSNSIVNNTYPSVICENILFIKDSGIVDVHSLSDCLEYKFIENSGLVQKHSELLEIERDSNGYLLTIKGPDQIFKIQTEILILAMGLHTEKFFSKTNSLDLGNFFEPLRYLIGRYYKCKNFDNFKHLIYPIPEKDSLGIHICFNLYDDYITFGPDAEEIKNINSPEKLFNCELEEKFYKNIETYIPNIRQHELQPDYYGIRPKLSDQDFKIFDIDDHGCEGLIALHGIESPGLTSSLSLGHHIASKL